MEWRVEISYEPTNEVHDTIIRELVGKDSDGSGYGFGMRDMSWGFRNLKTARSKFDKLNKLAKKHKNFEYVSLELKKYY